MKNQNIVIGIFCALLILIGGVPATAEAVFRGQDTTNLIDLLKIKRSSNRMRGLE